MISVRLIFSSIPPIHGQNKKIHRNYVAFETNTDKNLTAKNLCRQTQPIDILLLHLHGRMNISVQSDTCIGMTKQFTESLWIETVCNTNCGIGMPEQMKRHTPKLTSFQNRLKDFGIGTIRTEVLLFGEPMITSELPRLLIL